MDYPFELFKILYLEIQETQMNNPYTCLDYSLPYTVSSNCHHEETVIDKVIFQRPQTKATKKIAKVKLMSYLRPLVLPLNPYWLQCQIFI